MSSTIRFKLKLRTSAQQARVLRRRALQNNALNGTELNPQLVDALHRTINTQMNGIIGALEMIRQNDLASDQSDMINLAQDSADNLLLEVDQLLASPQDFSSPIPLETASDPVANIKMMLVYADADQRSRIENKLQLRGVRVNSFELPNDALVALEKAAEDGDPYRIVLLDQNMAGISGETLGIAISNSPLYRDALIILMSDEHSRSDADRLTHAGFSAWLPKPTPHSMLLNTLRMLCTCIVKKDAPRFVCAGVRFAATLNTKLHAKPSADGTDFFAGFSHARILAVDDHAVNLHVAKSMLARFGCEVDTASSGEQALQLVHARHYDLVLMDCQMPQMDGYQTTALLRAMESADSHTIIIGWSAGTRHNERDTCLAIGMDDFIAKPIRLRSLHELLTRWLSATASSMKTVQQDDELDATQQMFGEDFSELAQLFLADSPKRLASLTTAIAEQDALATGRLAHVLCGSTASLGATALAALCRDLEIKAKNHELDDAPARLHAIEREYARINAKLDDMLHPAIQTEPGNTHGKH